MEKKKFQEFDIEGLERSVANENPQDRIQILEGIIERFQGEDGINFLRILLFQEIIHTGKDREAANAVLADIVSNTLKGGSSFLPNHELLTFCFALIRLKFADAVDLSAEKIQVILKRNFPDVVSFFDKNKFPFLVPTDDNGRPPPPAPKRIPPRRDPGSLQNQNNERRQALPGYTPGWLAAEYAAKRKL
jgi:hypothetical protein